MSLQRIIAIFGSAVLATALLAAPRAQADQHMPKRMNELETTIFFGFDSAELDEKAKQRLDEVAAWLKKNPKRVVVVAGHTDEVGQEDYNLVLGKERARQTQQYLAKKGIAPRRIITVSFGEDFPVSPKAAKNRRTVFYATRPEEMKGMQQQVEDGTQQQQADGYAQQQQADGYAQQQQDKDEDADILGIEPREETPEGLLDGEAEEAEHLLTPYGLSISAGGGVTGFLSGDMRAYSGLGGAWDVRFVFGTRMPVAGEAMYFGTLHGIDADGLDDDAMLLGNGLETNLRVNVLRQERFQPYLIAGLGWTHYSLVNASFNTSSIRGSDNLVHVPLGAGVGFRAAGFLVDVRGTMRIAFGEDMVRVLPEEPESIADMSTWALTARVGWEF